MVRESLEVRIPPLDLEGDLAVPAGARSLILFAHGSGSSRFSPRNRLVAERLAAQGMATLLMDLLTAHEERTVDLRFDIPLLAGRVVVATQWLQRRTDTGHLPIGYFGASTGAAAALVAAARNPGDVFAVVSRGGRPDLAGDALASVSAPTLLIVGGRDEAVLAVNRDALGSLNPASQLEIVPGATHLFEEPGTLERVTQLAAEWFRSHLPPGQ